MMEEILKELNLLKERVNSLEKERLLEDREITNNIPNNKETKKEKSNIPMPWTGVINNDLCRGLRVNYGLYTQCENTFTKDSTFCKTCLNQGTKNGSNKPNSGTVDDRLCQPIMNYRDKKSGKTPTPWCQVIKKLNISMDEAINQAKEMNITISPEQLADSEKKRGRPKKNITNVSDTDSEEGGVGDVSPKKKRGRPKKEQKPMETVAGDDLIANIIRNLAPEQAVPENGEKLSDELEEDKIDSDDEDEPTEVKKLTIDNIDYLVDRENTVYDMETQEEIGYYDQETNSIIKDGL